MRKLIRILGKIALYGLVTIVALLLVAILVLITLFPRKEEPADIVIEQTPERVERGRYLAENVATCDNCHSERMYQYYAGPVDPDVRWAGTFVTLYGQPTAHSGNLTPAGLGDWTDGEVVRAITAGIQNDGSAVHPLMSFDTYAKMSEEDVHAVVAYLRTVAPVERPQPDNELSLMFLVIQRILPSPWEPPPPIDRSDTVAYGGYLAELGECRICHGFDLGGGRTFDVPGGGQVVASNISPSPTGIGGWSRENFIGAFKAFEPADSHRIPVGPGDGNTVMPWIGFAGMTEEDLGSIYDYLRTFQPVDRQIRQPDAAPPAVRQATAPGEPRAGGEAAPE